MCLSGACLGSDSSSILIIGPDPLSVKGAFKRWNTWTRKKDEEDETYLGALDLRTRRSTNTRFNLRSIFALVLKKDTREKFILLFFTKKVSTVIYTGGDSKMIKNLTFDNLFPPLRHSR